MERDGGMDGMVSYEHLRPSSQSVIHDSGSDPVTHIYFIPPSSRRYHYYLLTSFTMCSRAGSQLPAGSLICPTDQ